MLMAPMLFVPLLVGRRALSSVAIPWGFVACARKSQRFAFAKDIRMSDIKCWVVLAVFFTTTPAKADDWPQFLGPQRDGTSAETGLAKTWLPKGPPRLWRKDVGEGFSGPAVAGVRLILFHRIKDEEVIEGLKASDGARLWKFSNPTRFEDDFRKGNGPRSTPVITDKRLIPL